MGWRGALRSIAAASRAAERESRRRQRELQRQLAALEKASELERCALTYEQFENRLQRLRSVHKECSCAIDWQSMASAIEPSVPVRSNLREATAIAIRDTYEPGFFVRLFRLEERRRKVFELAAQHARTEDARQYEQSLKAYAENHATWKESKELAEKVLAADPQAMMDAIKETNRFKEIAELGSEVHFAIKDGYAGALFADVRVHGTDIIPKERLTLLKNGRLSSKAIPAAEANSLYQDYVCSVMLRIARELFAVLPVDIVFVTASDELLDTSSGHSALQTIASAKIPRDTLDKLNMDALDPSDSFRNFVHNMEFTPKGGFRPVLSLAPLSEASAIV